MKQYNSLLRIILINLFFYSFTICIAQTASKNYVTTYKPQTRVTNEWAIPGLSKVDGQKAITYYDGLGRSDQVIQVSGSPLGYDIVQPVEYDGYGREEKKYLPYPLTSANNGAYVSSDLTGQSSYYTGVYGATDGAKAFSKTDFESSPLNRVLKQGATGDAWQPNSNSSLDHSVKVFYKTNIANEVKRWKMVGNTLTDDGYYASSTLFKTVSYDENTKVGPNGSRIEEFKDNQGKVVLKITCDSTSTGTIKYYTYYVYDDFDQLRVVIPPKAAVDQAVSANELDSLCYRYRYNERRLMVMKKLPGADSICMVYDARDRLVLSQDGVLRPSSKWLFTKYDQMNRPIISGCITLSGLSADTLRARFKRYTSVLYESPISSGNIGYSLNNSYPSNVTTSIDSTNILTLTFYDNYTHLGVKGFPALNYLSTYDIDDYVDNDGNNNGYFDYVKGQITGTKIKVLDNNEFTTSEKWLCNVNYYDDRYRVIQGRRSLYDAASGGAETLANKYDFPGRILQTKQVQTFNSITTTVDKYFYCDHMSRQTKIEQQITGDATGKVAVLFNIYNEIGQLTDKKLHKTPSIPNYLQSVDYTYNIRGWLASLNNPDNLSSLQPGDTAIDLFGERLVYNTTETGLSGTNQYNGNISAMVWNSTQKTKQGYGFSYDGLSRLKLGDYKTYTSSWIESPNYEEKSLQYDYNGNLTRLIRTNSTGGNSADYSYTYKGNELDKINLGTAYVYDKNANTTTDGLRGFTIAYNILNLPKSITKSSDNIAYIYSAMGEKLAKKMVGNTYQYYAGGMVYDNTKALSYILFEEGLVNKGGGGAYSYEYHLKDHLGNTRVTFQPDGNGTSTTQVAEYYPFGYNFQPINPAGTNKYLYNGKEIQSDVLSSTNLDWYDYGARMYDPQIGRWTTVDPKADKYPNLSPYDYVANNPLKFIDPDGKEIVFIVRDKGGSNNQLLTYSNGNFRYQNGNIYDPNKGSISKGLDRTLAAYNKIESSGDKVLLNQLKTLETSKNTHFVEEGSGSGVKPYDSESASRAEKNVKSGNPVGTSTILDFSKEARDDFKKVEGIEDSDASLISHEMKHQYDYETGNMKDAKYPPSAESPQEIRAVNNENRIRGIDGLNKRTTYGGEEIDKKKLD